MAQMMPRLAHLDSPITYVPAQITRYAPLHMAPEMFNIPEAYYHKDYDIIFSKKFMSQSGFEMNDFCYFFERPFENTPRLEKLYAEMEGVITNWRIAYYNQTAKLQWVEDDREGVIVDSRLIEQTHITLSPLECAILKAMEEPISLTQLITQFLSDHGESNWQEALARLDDMGLFFVDEDKAVALPLKKDAKVTDSVEMAPPTEQVVGFEEYGLSV